LRFYFPFSSPTGTWAGNGIVLTIDQWVVGYAQNIPVSRPLYVSQDNSKLTTSYDTQQGQITSSNTISAKWQPVFRAMRIR
jgi:hypothetical protein